MNTGILNTPGITAASTGAAPFTEDMLRESIATVMNEPKGGNLNGPRLPPQRRRPKTRRDKSRAARARRGGRS